jgi:hypothetical protein
MCNMQRAEGLRLVSTYHFQYLAHDAECKMYTKSDYIFECARIDAQAWITDVIHGVVSTIA